MHVTRFQDNIKYRFVFVLMFGSALISVGFFAYNYQKNKHHLETQVNKRADLIIERLSQNLIVPLWEVDETWVGTITDTEVMSDDVKAICVSGEGDLTVCRERTDKGKIVKLNEMYADDCFMQRSSPIIHDGQEIGEVKIFFTDSNLKEELARELMANVYLAIFIMFFLILGPMLILERLVLIPLNKILTIVKNADKEGSFTKVEIMREDQIGLLAQEFNKMMENIKQKEKMMLSQSRQAAMGEMISMIAHQWRQPITAIAMGANNILYDAFSGKADPKVLQEYAEKIVEQTVHLGKTIDDFKNFFSPDKKREYVYVDDVIKEALSVVEKSLEVHDIRLIKEYAKVDRVLIYSRELLQVMLNIINNAKEALVEFKVQEPTILITLYQDKENINISICNNGSGIKQEILDKIFEPYFTTKDKNGTGLGLYMSKTIIEKHFNGTIYAKNKETDGVCFYIAFPKNNVRSEND